MVVFLVLVTWLQRVNLLFIQSLFQVIINGFSAVTLIRCQPPVAVTFHDVFEITLDLDHLTEAL